MDDRGLVVMARLQVLAAVGGLLVLTIGGALALGVVGAPSVEGVDNRFGEVTNETTIVHTDLRINNPNPIGIQLGGTTVEYTVWMNEVPMAAGGSEGIAIGRGDTSLPFRTTMDNERIPAWWTSHVDGGERTTVWINATVRSSLVGEQEFDLTENREVETDLIGEFNSDEVREVNADDPPPTTSNPVLYVNRTGATWGPVTDERTPMDLEFLVYNPHLEPYAITELGYEITMNEVPVGEGATEDVFVVPGGQTETVETRAAIRSRTLDDWWVTHLRNDQVTDVRIELYALIELPTGQEIHVPLEELTYEETVETDLFDNEDGSNDDAENDGSGTATGADGEAAGGEHRGSTG